MVVLQRVFHKISHSEYGLVEPKVSVIHSWWSTAIFCMVGSEESSKSLSAVILLDLPTLLLQIIKF